MILMYFKISLIVFLYIAKKIWDVLYIFWIGPAVHKLDIKSFGKWAMVTGSTDGIGKEYARQLAARGCNIVLVSRSLEKLKNVASEIEKKFNVETKIVQIDFTGNLSIYDKLAKEIEGLEIGTLINNVGLSYTYMEYFLDIPDWNDQIKNMLNVNIVSMIHVTAIVLPNMVKRNKGIIVNVGSATNDFPSPLLTVYAATKAFVAKFTEGLRYEYGSNNLLIQCVAPHLVSTNMSGLPTNPVIAPSETYVKSALSLIGTTSYSSGYFIHSCVGFCVNLFKSVSEDFWITVTRKVCLIGRKVMKESINLRVPNTKTFPKKL